jgi:transposase
MFPHSCARSCPQSRVLLVRRVREEGWTIAAAAEAAGLSERTAYKWLRRFRVEGAEGLKDRRSRPHS